MNNNNIEENVRKFPRAVGRRRNFLEKRFDKANLSVLEIGAMDMPTFYPDEVSIEFLDYYTNEEFASLSAAGKLSRPLESLMPVEIVAKEKYFSSATHKKYDLIIANHVIEHVPDLISWLRELQNLLKVDGWIFLAIPDKRYTFDYNRAVTSVVEIYRRYVEDAKSPDIYTIADYFYLQRDVRIDDFWKSNTVELENKLSKSTYTFSEALKRAKVSVNGFESHVNIHCNVFSAPTFKETWSAIDSIAPITGMTLKLKELVDVMTDANEFWVLLQLPKQLNEREIL
jgi:predicted SAM-dependent methyltransferase